MKSVIVAVLGTIVAVLVGVIGTAAFSPAPAPTASAVAGQDRCVPNAPGLPCPVLKAGWWYELNTKLDTTADVACDPAWPARVFTLTVHEGDGSVRSAATVSWCAPAVGFLNGGTGLPWGDLFDTVG